VALAAAGDAEAFERLYRTYHPLALNVARQCTGMAADAEDAAQTVFMWLLSGRWRLDPDTVTHRGNLYGFVKVLAVHASWRSWRPIEERDADELTVALLRIRSPWPTPEELLLRRELRQRIAAAIGSLPRQYRRAAMLRYYRQLAGPDIARELGIAAVTVPGYLHQIRARLRAALAAVTSDTRGGRADASSSIVLLDARLRHARRTSRPLSAARPTNRTKTRLGVQPRIRPAMAQAARVHTRA